MSSHRPVHAANLPAPVGPYSPGMGFERLIFVSGQGATDPATGTLAGNDVATQTEQCLKTCKRSSRPQGRICPMCCALGIVLYEMLAGRVPFEADSTLSVIYKQINDPPPPIPGISPAVQKVIDRALAKNPEDRHPTSRNMAVDFFLAIGMTAEAETIINALPEASKTIIGALPDATPKPVDTNVKPKPSGRKPAQIGLGILSVIGLFALAIGAFFIFSKPSISSNASDVQNPESATPTAEIVSSESSGLPGANGMSEIV